jgi:hypothetical protein
LLELRKCGKSLVALAFGTAKPGLSPNQFAAQ